MVAIRGHFDGKVIVPDEPVQLPQNEPLLVRVDRMSERPLPTASELLSSGAVGLWRDRTDIEDTPGFARQLREQAQNRQR